MSRPVKVLGQKKHIEIALCLYSSTPVSVL